MALLNTAPLPPKNMKVLLTILITALFAFAYRAYSLSYSLLVAKTNAAVLDDTDTSFIIARIVSSTNFGTYMVLIYLVVLAMVWYSTIKRAWHNPSI